MSAGQQRSGEVAEMLDAVDVGSALVISVFLMSVMPVLLEFA